MFPLKRRIFVGNLPPGTVEADIRRKFHKYGKINSVEIKQRGDSSTFAFLDLETDPEKLNACFAIVSRKPWNGYEVKLEVAKESFLSRLAKERQHKKSKEATERHDCPAQFQTAKKPRKDLEHSPGKESTDYILKIKKETSESSDSSSDVETKGRLKMFRGTKHFLLSSKSVTSIGVQLKKKGKLETLKENIIKTEEDLDAEKKSSDLLQRLEMFSDVWKDSFDGLLPARKHWQRTDACYVEAEEKRMKSVVEKRKSFQKQKDVIKIALSNVFGGKPFLVNVHLLECTEFYTGSVVVK